MRDLGLVKEYLGLQVKRDQAHRVLYFHQIPYAVKILKRFGLEQSKPVRTPLPSGYISHPAPVGYNATPELRTKYQSIIGSLLFIMLGTRPDIAFAVIRMSQYMANPTEEHAQKSLHIVRYLTSTQNLGLEFTGLQHRLEAYADSDWAGDPESH